MSLSNLEAPYATASLTPKLSRGRLLIKMKRDAVGVFREVSSSPHFYPAALRVGVALAIAFGLVRLAKFLLT